MSRKVVAGLIQAAVPIPENGASIEQIKESAIALHVPLIEEAGKKGVGPSLNGLIGRQSGSLADFAYSPAMKGAGVTWNEENLLQYIADPKGFVAGNKMAFAGVKKEEDLKNVVAYLLEAAK